LQLFEECKNICKQKTIYTDLQICNTILQIAEYIHKIKAMITEEEMFAPQIIKTNKISYLCIEYINQHLNEPLSLEHLEKVLNISASHIRQTFKKEIGLTVHKYILVQKMQFANRLLSQGHSPVAVAEQLGYEYYSTFYQNYVSYFRQSPKINSHLAHQRLFVDD
jgi:AraC-like DNA-binding protein